MERQALRRIVNRHACRRAIKTVHELDLPDETIQIEPLEVELRGDLDAHSFRPRIDEAGPGHAIGPCHVEQTGDEMNVARGHVLHAEARRNDVAHFDHFATAGRRFALSFRATAEAIANAPALAFFLRCRDERARRRSRTTPRGRTCAFSDESVHRSMSSATASFAAPSPNAINSAMRARTPGSRSSTPW